MTPIDSKANTFSLSAFSPAVEQRARVLLILLTAAIAFSITSGAEARKPVPDGGRIDFGPGWRFEPLRGSSSFGAAGRFSWQMDSKWFLGIEVGAWSGGLAVERLGLEESPSFDEVKVWVGDLRFALGAHLREIGPVWTYAVGGGGYHVVGVLEDGRYREGATQALFFGVGAYVPFGKRTGFFLENRWTFMARLLASVGQETPMIDAGGNLLWAGLVVFFEPAPSPGRIGR